MPVRRLALLCLAAAGLCSAATPRAIASKVEATLQGKTRIGIVCNYAMTQSQVMEIAANLDPALQVTVVDTRHPDTLDSACHVLERKQIDCLLLLPWDPHFSAKSQLSQQLVNRVKKLGIPVVNPEHL